jgi:hypothetical protein
MTHIQGEGVGKGFVEQQLGSYKDNFKKFLEARKLDPASLLIPMKYAGFHIAPVILLKGTTDSMADVVGAGVATFTLVSTVQVLGSRGFVLWATVYGIGSAIAAMLSLLS